jgi:hypothetical protein
MRKPIIAAIALTASACIPGNSPIRIVGTIGLDNKCVPDTSVIVSRGSLDLAGAGAYIATLLVDSELTIPTNMDMNGVDLVSPGTRSPPTSSPRTRPRSSATRSARA